MPPSLLPPRRASAVAAHAWCVFSLRRGFVLLVIALCPAAGAAADTLDDRIGVQKKAATELITLLDAARQGNDADGLVSTNTTRLVGVVADRATLLEQPPYTSGDTDRLLGICTRTRDIVSRLVMLDIPLHPAPGQSRQAFEAERRHGLQRNNQRFQAHQAVLMPFMLRCMARAQPLLQQQFAGWKADEFQDSTRKLWISLRDEMEQTYSVAIGMASFHPVDNDAFEDAMAAALVETAPAYATLLSPAQRVQVGSKFVGGLPHASPRIVAQLHLAAAAFRSTSCSNLCAL